eukprot:6197671-Pleurochrysis_carterae.AAC.1
MMVSFHDTLILISSNSVEPEIDDAIALCEREQRRSVVVARTPYARHQWRTRRLKRKLCMNGC